MFCSYGSFYKNLYYQKGKTSDLNICKLDSLISILSNLSLKNVVPHPKTESLVLVTVQGVDTHPTITNTEKRCMGKHTAASIIGKG